MLIYIFQNKIDDLSYDWWPDVLIWKFNSENNFRKPATPTNILIAHNIGLGLINLNLNHFISTRTSEITEKKSEKHMKTKVFFKRLFMP